VTYAEERGVLVVAAAGNRNTNVDLHPAADPRVLSVGCCDAAGRLAFSTTLAPTTDLLAPGVAVTAAVPGGSHASVTGSSAAAAQVAAAASLVRGLAPDLDPPRLRALFRGATRPLALFADEPDLRRAFPAGPLDVGRLVARLDRGGAVPALSDARTLPARAAPGEPVAASVRLANHGLEALPAGALRVALAGLRRPRA